MSKFLSAGESFAGKESTWVELLIRGGMLKQNSTYTDVGAVHLNNELEFWVCLGENWSGSEAVLEFP
jgi:hypothetical protein